LDKTTDSQITQVDANKAFYIHVIASDDFGITQVRFSSDDSQEGNPTGSWTEWLSWDTSSSHWTGYWNAVTKKKEWTFTTAGSKEVWAEVKDTSGKTKSAKANIYCYSPTKEEWVSYVPTPEQTEIEISTEGGVASAKVILTFPNAGYRVTDWGTVRRDGNELSAEAKVERWTGASAQVITALNHTYNLGTLAPGAYKFTFKAWGQTVESKAFEIKPELKPSMNIQPTAWSDSVEAGKSKSQTFTVSASGGTVKNVILTKISGPDWLAVSSPSLGDIPAGSSKRFMIIASPPTGISGLFGYSVRITCAEGEPKSVDVSGTITVLWPASPTPTADVFQFPVGKLNQLGIRIATKEKGDDDGWSVEENFGDFDADIRGYHPGEDWNRDTEGDTDVGENVYAVANGIVYDIKESVKRGLGGGVVIRHALTDGTEVYSVYVHIEPSRDLRIGQAVNRGIPVGKIAKIDLPAHLHFEIRTKPTKPVEQGGWYPNDMGNGYYETTEKMREDGFLDPSQFILSHIGREIPELKQKLKERISLLLEGSVDTYPPHLQVPFAQSKYDELYKAGIDFNVLSVEALEKAERLLEEGDPGGAQKYLNRALRLRMASDGCFSAAAEVAEKRYKTIQDVIRPIYELDKIAAKAIAVGIPGAEPLINALYFSTDFAIDYSEAGWEEAVKNRAADIAVDVLLSEIKIDGRALEDLLKNRIGKVTFPVIQEAVEKNKQAIASKIAKQLGLELAVWASEKTGKELDRVSNQIAEEAARLVRSWLMSRLKSPGELRVYDSQGRVTGLVRGEVKNEIPRSVYDNEAVIIFYPTDSYCYEVAGTDNGVYGLEVTSAESGKVNAFAVSSVPTSAGCVHHYAIDWSALVASEGRGGVAVRIDSDGDGTFENVFSPLALEKTEIAPPVRIITPELAVLETPQDLSRPVSLGEKFEMHLRRVKPEVPLELRMENSKISRVLVDLKKARENVKVTIEKLQGRPSGLPNPPGLTWAYCRIEVSVPDDAVENAEIDFWVSKEWLSFHQIDKRDIRLLRFEGGWKELKTEVCEEDAACVIYRAMTPAFSVFAVTARAPLPSALGKVASASALAVILISVLAVLRRRRGKGVCFNCGKEPPAGARFCPFCGAKLEGSLREREPSRELPVPSRSKTRPNLRAPAGKARKARALGGRNTLRKQRKVLRPRGPLGPRTLGPRTVLRSKEKKSEGFIEDLSQLR
jgi:PGF-pre-PGF domain-containing protein